MRDRVDAMTMHSGTVTVLLFALSLSVPLVGQAPPAPERPTAEQRVLAALAAPDPQVRAGAAMYLAWFGDGAHVARITALRDDDDALVRRAALRALAFRADEASRGVFLDVLGRDNGDFDARLVAVSGLEGIVAAHGVLSAAEIEGVRDIAFCSSDARVRVFALRLLADCGEHGLTEPMCDLLEHPLRRDLLYDLTEVLSLVEDIDSAPCLRDLLADRSALNRHRAAAALVRLGIDAPEDRAHILPDFVEDDAYFRENTAAFRARCAQGYAPIEEREFERALAEAHVVLVGESHHDPHVRELQRRLIAQLTEAWKSDPFCVGCETCVYLDEDLGMHEVVDFAEANGWQSLTLEPETDRELLSYAWRQRDASAVASITAWRNAHANGHMLVLYGFAHLLGHISGALTEPSISVITNLTPAPGLLRVLGDDPDPSGRVFTLGTTGNVFYLPTELLAEMPGFGGAKDRFDWKPLMDWLAR